VVSGLQDTFDQDPAVRDAMEEQLYRGQVVFDLCQFTKILGATLLFNVDSSCDGSPRHDSSEIFEAHRRQRDRSAHGRAISNGSTFAPPAIAGFDGSKCSRNSRFLTRARAKTKASFRPLTCRRATLKKASPK
jgi:hypothetical protein